MHLPELGLFISHREGLELHTPYRTPLNSGSGERRRHGFECLGDAVLLLLRRQSSGSAELFRG